MVFIEAALLNIIDDLRACGKPLSSRALERIIAARNRELKAPYRAVTKKALLPFYLNAKAHDPTRWRTWNVDAATETNLVRTLRMKPTRTASGVATITVITRPQPCMGTCLFCPNDVRMPKSYLSDEPACQRAERNFFDPYLQVASRLQTLFDMGHTTDKVELIVLGGTWTNYSAPYRAWFVSELFSALNDADNFDTLAAGASSRRRPYEDAHIPCEREDCAAAARTLQTQVNAGKLTYNEAISQLYGEQSAWRSVTYAQRASIDEVYAVQRKNERALHRAVGLVMETRPDEITPETLGELRLLGATKIQLGIQSLNKEILMQNARGISLDTIGRAFELARLFGFKLHAHFMANLVGATPETDKCDYRQLFSNERIMPDEIKLYPCSLVDGTELVSLWRSGQWSPYSESELIDVLVSDVVATPPYVRISRMVRDISAHDIMVGNKKVNLRQLVDMQLAQQPVTVQEIRSREIRDQVPNLEELRLGVVSYKTSVSTEHFFQWVTDQNKIAGFGRLSLPYDEALRTLGDAGPLYEALHTLGDAAPYDEALRTLGNTALPYETFSRQAPQRQTCKIASVSSADQPDDASECTAIAQKTKRGAFSIAMIRELHVYGVVVPLHHEGAGAQHLGLGRRLVDEACKMARASGCACIGVISAVGTREYYRGLGFSDGKLYQWKDLRA